MINIFHYLPDLAWLSLSESNIHRPGWWWEVWPLWLLTQDWEYSVQTDSDYDSTTHIRGFSFIKHKLTQGRYSVQSLSWLNPNIIYNILTKPPINSNIQFYISYLIIFLNWSKRNKFSFFCLQIFTYIQVKSIQMLNTISLNCVQSGSLFI